MEMPRERVNQCRPNDPYLSLCHRPDWPLTLRSRDSRTAASLPRARGGTPDRRLSVHVRVADECDVRVGEYAGLFAMSGEKSLSRHPAWLAILQNALRHVPHCIEGHWEGKLRAILPVGRGPQSAVRIVSR